MEELKSKFINEEALEHDAEVMRALAHPLRLRILKFIDDHKRINVNKIYHTLKLEQSITSQHLRILRGANIVVAQRDGKFIHYTINYEKVKHTVDVVTAFFVEQEKKKKKK